MASRLSCIDGLKVLASQIIVLHHLSVYGPIADAAHQFFPQLSSWLFDYGRMAVQVFLVAGGFLAARSLAPAGVLRERNPIELFTRRYLRLIVPLLGAVIAAIVCAQLARSVMVDDAIPRAPGTIQLLAHFFLLQDLLGIPALSAGLWYVAIDFQLYSLTVVLLWAALRFGRTTAWVRFLGVGLVSSLIVLSLFWFNLDADWDVVAPYHFAAYGMGVLSYWLSTRKEVPVFWCCVAILAVAASLAVGFRTRIALAAVVSVMITLGGRHEGVFSFFDKDLVRKMSGRSYALFLIHFPVCLVANALFHKLGIGGGYLSLAAWLLVVWLVCQYLAASFHRVIEVSAGKLLEGLVLPVQARPAMA